MRKLPGWLETRLDSKYDKVHANQNRHFNLETRLARNTLKIILIIMIIIIIMILM